MSIFDILANSGRIRELIGSFGQSLKEEVVEGSAGGGMVVVTISGSMEVRSVRIEPELLKDGDAEMLGDLVAAAVSQALERAKELVASRIREMGLGIDPSALMG